MMHSRWAGILAILFCTGIALFFLPGDEKSIEKKLAELGEFCSTPKGEAPFETLKKAAGAARLCTNSCQVTINSRNLDKMFNQKEISDNILMMKKRLPETIFSFHDTVVDIVADGRAKVITTVKLDGTSVDGRFVDAYEIDIEMKKENGEWLFSAFKVVEFMEK